MNILDSIKTKYVEEMGLRLNFFEAVSFVILLISSYLLLTSGGNGVWTQLWDKSLSALFIGDGSLIQSSRVVDYIIAAILISVLSIVHRKIGAFFFTLYPQNKLDAYIKTLSQEYTKASNENNAVRLYLANEAKSQKEILMKRFRTIKSSGLLFITMLLTSILGIEGGFVEYLVIFVAIIGLLVVHVRVILFYISEIAPLLVAERVYRGDKVEFGDEK